MRNIRFVVLAGLLSALPGTAQAALLTVTTTGDGADSAPGNGVCAASGGGCTLRAAIQEANALAGTDTIQFSIGSGAQTIVLSANLPTITQAVVIDGWTQPGYAGSPIIFVNGNNKSGPGLNITGGGATVRGLVIGNFSGHGIVLKTGGGNVLEGNYIGMGPGGQTTAANSGHGIIVDQSANNRIGGTTIAQRNLISKNTAKGGGGGIVLDNANGNAIQGNFIGTDITGMVEHPNEARGIAVIGSSNNMIGGPEPGAGNLIAGNRATGVRMLGGSSNNTVQANFIGVNRTITGVIPNDRGVQIRDGDGNKVIANLIAGNTYDGVLVWGGTNSLIQGNIITSNGFGPVGDPQEQGWFGVWVATGTGNQVLGNRIFGNYLAGINVGEDIVQNPNDAGDGDTGANGMQNHPVITSAVRGASTTAVAGGLNSTPNTQFRIQFFANPACDLTVGPANGEGEHFLGELAVASNGAGDAGFSVTIGAAVPVGWVMTATATGPTGTSEFSACRLVQ